MIHDKLLSKSYAPPPPIHLEHLLILPGTANLDRSLPMESLTIYQTLIFSLGSFSAGRVSRVGAVSIWEAK